MASPNSRPSGKINMEAVKKYRAKNGQKLSFGQVGRIFAAASKGEFLKKGKKDSSADAPFNPFAKYGDRYRSSNKASREAGRKYDSLYGDYMADGSYKPHDYQTMKKRIGYMGSGNAKKAMQYRMKRMKDNTSSWRSM